MKYPILILLIPLALLCACSSRPSGVLSRGELEEVLYDYHIMQGIIDQLPDSTRRNVAQDYINAVFQKHNITEAQFDSSITYYNRNTKDLAKIYNSLQSRFADNNEAIKLQTGNNDFNAIFAEGDTANIWAGSKMIMLANHDMLRTANYSIVCDTTCHQRDQFTLIYTPLFIASGDIRGRSVTAGLSIVYKGGKTVGITQQVAYSNAQQLTLKANDDTDIERINIFFFYRGVENNSSSCAINNISLIQMHEKGKDTAEEEAADTIKADTVAIDTAATHHSRNITAEEAREENKTDKILKIQTAPTIRHRNQYAPRRRRK